MFFSTFLLPLLQPNNNEYGKIITTIEKYRNDLNDKNLLLNLDIIILLYYQFHDKKGL